MKIRRLLIAGAAVVTLFASVAKAAAGVMLWELPLEDRGAQLSVSGPFLLVKTQSFVRYVSWEAAAIEQPFTEEFEGEYQGEFRTSSLDGSLKAKVILRDRVLVYQKDKTEKQVVLDALNGRVNRVVAGPEGNSLVLYRQGNARADQESWFHWLSVNGEKTMSWRAVRAASDPKLFFSSRETYLAVVDEDLVNVYNKRGLVHQFTQDSNHRRLNEPQVLISETSRSLVLIEKGEGGWAQGWDFAGRRLFDVNLPANYVWTYTEGAPVMAGASQDGGKPLLLKLKDGEMTALEGLPAITQAVTSADGRLVAVLNDGALQTYMITP